MSKQYPRSNFRKRTKIKPIFNFYINFIKIQIFPIIVWQHFGTLLTKSNVYFQLCSQDHQRDGGIDRGMSCSRKFRKKYMLYWNSRDLTEAEDTKKRWQEYTEEQYKKDLHDPDNHDGVIAHLEPDILECEVKWALGKPSLRTKLVEVMEF